MDCFYAAIEMRERPELADQPLAVGGTSGRAILTTCNYPARKYGLHSAMPVFQARRLCPHLVLLPVRFDLYRQVSREIRSILSQYTDRIEPLSLDEAYLDLSHHKRRGSELAAEIRDRIRSETGLTASAGVGPNKLVAKIASDWNKPDGQCVVSPSRVRDFMRELPVRRIWGVGPKSTARLAELGIETCAQLQDLTHADLVQEFGSFGFELYHLCRGEDDRPVQSHRIRKSLSNERTFSRDLVEFEECEEALREQQPELLDDLRMSAPERPIAKLFVKLKFTDFRVTTAEAPGRQPRVDAYLRLLRQAWGRSGKPVRLLGLGVRFAETRGIPEQLELCL